jgi:hypothetical protein
MKNYLVKFKYKSNPNDFGLWSSGAQFDFFTKALQFVASHDLTPHRHTQYAIIEHTQTHQEWFILYF